VGSREVTTALAAAWTIAAPLSRSDAQAAARRELSKLIYQRERPSPLARLLQWLADWLSQALGAATGYAPGGLWGLLGLLAVLVGVAVAVRWRVGQLSRTAAARRPLPLATVSAAEHRRRADREAAAGRYAEAVRERLAAIAADLQERAVLDPRPGRTADELAAEAAAARPAAAELLARAARAFDDIWYGGRPATAAADRLLRAADEQVQAARPADLATAGTAPSAVTK